MPEPGPNPQDRPAAPAEANGAARDRWRRALPEEVRFWSDWLATGGLRWSDEFRARLDRSTPLQPDVVRELPETKGRPPQLLDVGAGPLTCLGKHIDGRPISITAVDPLADEYDRCLDDVGITPPVRTIRGEAEHLDELFESASFDLVFCNNALDHSHDPLRAIRQMLRVVRPGRTVLLRHAVNEGERERYTGLHQWNFCIEDDRFIIWRPDARIDVGSGVPDTNIRFDRQGDMLIVAMTQR